jgi:hypothetical protein
VPHRNGIGSTEGIPDLQDLRYGEVRACERHGMLILLEVFSVGAEANDEVPPGLPEREGARPIAAAELGDLARLTSVPVVEEQLYLSEFKSRGGQQLVSNLNLIPDPPRRRC